MVTLCAVTLPHPEVAAQLYEITVAEAETAGLKQYEVSNFAKEGQECRHNLNYWSGGDCTHAIGLLYFRSSVSSVIGIGPGAAGRLTVDGKRRSFMQLKVPDKWSAAIAARGRGTGDEQILSDEENLQVRNEIAAVHCSRESRNF